MKSKSIGTNFHRLSPIVAYLGLAFAGGALAQESPFYVGVVGGQAKQDFDFRSQVRVLSNGTINVTQASITDDKDTGYKLTLGYRFSPQIAVELDYVDLGEMQTSYLFEGLGRFTRFGTYKIDGFNVSGVFSHAVNDRLSVFGRAGVLYSNYKYAETGENFPAFNPSPTPPIHSFTAPNLKRGKLSYGVGVDYKLNAQLSVRLGWDRYTELGNSIADNETGNGKFDVDLVTLGAVMRF